MKKTLYVSDLDGTLLNNESALSPFTAEALNRLIKSGLLFSYATARSFATASKVAAGLTVNIPVIVYNGGAIMESATGKALYRVLFTGDEQNYVKLKLLKHGLAPLVYAVQDTGTPGERETVSYDNTRVTPAIKAYLTSRAGDSRLNPVAKEMVFTGVPFYFTTIHEDKQALASLYEELENDPRFNIQLSRDLGGWWLEIMPKKSTKAQAVAHLRESFACDELVVFGDGINDIPLFLAADRAYAVENAVEKLKVMSTKIIKSNQADGVARFLLEEKERMR